MSRPRHRPPTRWPASCSHCSASTSLPWRSSPRYTFWPAWQPWLSCCPTSTSSWCCGQTSQRTRPISTTTTTTKDGIVATLRIRVTGSIPTWWLRPILDSWKKAVSQDLRLEDEKAQKAGNFSPVAFSGTLGLKLCVFLTFIFIVIIRSIFW